jgi:hypothetical protein
MILLEAEDDLFQLYARTSVTFAWKALAKFGRYIRERIRAWFETVERDNDLNRSCFTL